MSDNREPKLEILYDPADVNTHQPAATYNDIGITVEKDDHQVGKQIDVLRKYLRVVVHNAGNDVAIDCKAKCRVIIADADKDNDNKLRYPSNDQKLLAWDGNYDEMNINVDDNEILCVAFADSDYPVTPIQEAPKRFASLATPRTVSNIARNGLVVQDSFAPGDYEIEVIVTTCGPPARATVKIHVDQVTLNTTITSVSTTT